MNRDDRGDSHLEHWVDNQIDLLKQSAEWQPNTEEALEWFRRRTTSRRRWSGLGMAMIVTAGAFVVLLALPWQTLFNRNAAEEVPLVVEAETPEVLEQTLEQPLQAVGQSELGERPVLRRRGQVFLNGELVWVDELPQPVATGELTEQERMERLLENTQGETDGAAGTGQGVGNGLGRGIGTGAGEGLGAGPGQGTGEGAATGGAVLRVGGGVTAPTVISRVSPELTEEARQAGVEGVVVLEGIVHEDGSFEVVRVVRSLGFGLDEEAIETVRQWRFRPGTRNGEPVAVSLNFEVNFTLN